MVGYGTFRFAVAEALADAAVHSGAEVAYVSMRRDGDKLRLQAS